MPELPEVETICRGIEPLVLGQTIEKLIIRQRQLRWYIPDSMEQTLTGQSIQSVTRRAKYLLFNTATGTLIIHLGMSGSLRVLASVTAAGKHDHIDIIFADSSLLRFNDPRRFGAFLWTAAPIVEHKLFANLGVEPLLDDFNADTLHTLSKNRKVPIKSFIMNSHIVVGVGNIYANESLFMAGLLPETPAGEIALAQYQILVDCIRVVLKQAITEGGTTLRDFVNESGKPGYFQQQLKVYGRAGKPCYQCLMPLKEIRLANRSTVFCEACQH
jgi:formamidopyrimidine-DNA glycosylase